MAARGVGVLVLALVLGGGSASAAEKGITKMEITSTAFKAKEFIPKKYSCEGDDVSPPLRWSEPPPGTRSLALVVDNPDAPGRTFTHWIAWGIDSATGGLAEGEAAPLEGRNDFGAPGYRGPCPPVGHGPHRYFFKLCALDADVDLARGARRRDVDAALEGHVLEVAELVGTYER